MGSCYMVSVEYNFVKVFSVTTHRERSSLGCRVTEWLEENKGHKVVNTVVRQSSDKGYHCLSIVLFCKV